MKLPVIRQIQRTSTPAEIETTIKVLEFISEAPSLKIEETDVIGELISNLCGALEVHQMIADGIPEKDAANTFMKRVIGSIDR
jgi:hypothetical protein